MKKYLIKLSFALCLMAVAGLAPQQLTAQAVCGSSGETVNTADFGNSSYAIGDLTVTPSTPATNPADITTADWYFGPAANVDVYAAITIPTGAVMRLKAGAVLNVYGNFTNNGYLFVEPGAIINFYGNTWANTATAVFGDGATAANTIPGGTNNFIAPRLAIPASLNASACVMSNYSGGNFLQSLDGGNVPMDIALHVQNANNVKLINTNTKLEGSLTFDVANGNVDLGNNNFTFTNNGTWTTNVTPNAAYFLTDGTTACAGVVEKQGLASTKTFVFPIGRAATYSGGRDFTPAILRNDGSAVDNFQILVKNYADAKTVSGVIVYGPSNGIDRAWQITSTTGNAVTMALQHNDATNGSDYTNVFGGDANAFVTQYQGAGIWDLGPIGTNITGNVGGSVIHTRGFAITTTAANCTADKSWFSKSNNSAHPLPIKLVSFTAKLVDCSAQLNWVTAEELNAKYFDLQRSTDGITFSSKAIVATKGSNSRYTYTDATPPKGIIQYRLRMVDIDGAVTYSPITIVDVNCSDIGINVFPNPVINAIKITAVKAGSIVRLMNSTGQVLRTLKATGSTIQMDMSILPAAIYSVQVVEANILVKTFKLVKK